MTTTCEWRPIPGWEGLYEVSEYGAVRSLDRVAVHPRSGSTRYRGRVLKLFRGADGRLRVRLWREGRGSPPFLVHYLVALSFIGPRPEGHDVCHLDDDKDNNHYSNLRYDTRSENMMDRVRNGIHHNANKTHCPRGHEYSGENLIVKPTKTGVNRFCRECKKRESHERYLRKKERERCAVPTAEDRSPTALPRTVRSAAVRGKRLEKTRTTAVRRSDEHSPTARK